MASIFSAARKNPTLRMQDGVIPRANDPRNTEGLNRDSGLGFRV